MIACDENSDFYWEITLFLDAVILQFEALILRKDYTNGIKYGHLETELFDLEKESPKYLNPYNYGSRYQYPIDTWH